MKVLMLTWEFPPFIAGGMGMACYGMLKSLVKLGIEVYLVIPTKKNIYFHITKPEDADQLTPIFLDQNEAKTYFETTQTYDYASRLEFLGFSLTPETYFYGTSISNNFDWLELLKQSKMHIKTVFENLESSNHYQSLFEKVKQYALNITRICKSIDFDCIHAHDWLTYPAGLVAAQISKKPFIAHVHATEFDRSGGVGDRRIHTIEYTGLANADKVIAVSNYTANILVNRYRIDTSKISIIHNAFYINKTGTEKKRIFKDPVILFLGRITLQKGPDYFLDVAKIVCNQYPHVRFIMAGAGDMTKKIIESSAYSKLKSHFLFTGFLNRNEVEEVLMASDILILPSVSEPFGIAPLEAMSFGLATIISNQSGVSEIIKNAYKVDFWDIKKMASLIIKLIENPELMIDFGKKAAEEVTHMQWDSTSISINKIYEDALCCQ